MGRVLTLTIILAIAFVSPAGAAIVTHSFTGHVSTIQTGGDGFSFDGTVSVGTSVSGSFSYDTATSPSAFDSFRTDYFPSPSSVFLSEIGSYSFTSSYRVRVANDLPQSGTVDAFTLEKNGDATFTNGTDTVTDLLWSMNLFDPTGTAFSSKDLPLALPPVSDFRDHFINLQVPRNSPQNPDTSTIVIQIDLLDSPPIPEPATLAIWSLLGGIGLVVGHRRRRKAA